MTRALFPLAVGLAFATAWGCGSSTDKPKTTAVKGIVTVDGKPMPEGEIYFVLSGQAPTTFPVKDGAFSGTGNVGKNAVEIRAYKTGPALLGDPNKSPTKVNTIPARFSDLSKLTADVTEGGANDFKFEINSK